MEIEGFSALLINDSKEICIKPDLLWILRRSSKMLWRMKYWDDVVCSEIHGVAEQFRWEGSLRGYLFQLPTQIRFNKNRLFKMMSSEVLIINFWFQRFIVS